MRQTVRAVLARTAARAGHHRQPGLLRCGSRVCVRRFDPTHPDHRLRLAVGLGLAAGAGARRCARYVDHVLALLPFEPDVHRRLGGPPCSYVGHPLIEEVAQAAPERARRRERRAPTRRSCWRMPGSRSGEIARLAGIFGETLGLVRSASARSRWWFRPCRISSPTGHAATASWPVKPRIVIEQADKQAALRMARAALAKSGTVTLELALAGVPMVAAYKVSALEAWVIRRLVRVPSVILANLVIGRERRAGTAAGGLHAGAACRSARRRCIGDTPERAAPGRSVRQARRHHGDRLARARRPRRRHRAGRAPAPTAARDSR